ncbi:Ger(x)C family spore germination protein [Paenibacillus piscarius]|uniref:Ger(x)C family spore germination protein n=1 Tax=Paenibacillus piscarius TaxID=1089681 RepID=UPI001EE9981D|nr:Ger(x)C family spore germination protein [Paenibacillus piscarius]
MKNRAYCLLLLMMLQTLLSGCWDSVELNRRAIVSGVAIDRGDSEAEKYRLSFQVIVAEEISGEKSRGISPVAVYTGTGRSMFEALANASRQTARLLSLGHIRVLVISEAFAREGIKDVLDVLERESDARLNSMVFISKGQPAHELMSTMTVFSKIPANDLVEKLETTSKQFGYNFQMAVDDVIRGIQIRGGGPVINGVFTTGDREQAESNENLKDIVPHSVLRVSALAAFKDDKLRGWLTGDAAMGTGLLHNRIRDFPSLIRDHQGGYLAFNVYQSQLALKVQSKDAEHPVFTVRITQQAALKESPNTLDLTSPQVLDELSQQLAEETVRKLKAAVASARDIKSDVLGFGQALQREDPHGWKKVREHWEDVFARCTVKYEADVVIRHTDMRSNSFQIN